MMNSTDGTINFFNLWWSLKRLFFLNTLGQLLSEETVSNDKEKMVYIELGNIKINGVFKRFRAVVFNVFHTAYSVFCTTVFIHFGNPI